MFGSFSLLPLVLAVALVWHSVADADPTGADVTKLAIPRGTSRFSRTRRLPEGPLIVGYATSCEDGGETILEEARAGVNVVIWFAANLKRSKQGIAEFSFALGSQKIHCIVAVARQLAAEGLPTAHLVSIGGWDAPHPDPGLSGAEYFAAFESFQAWVSSQQSQGPGSPWSFDGIDWDLEGNDDVASPSNEFSLETVAVMGEFSQLAKATGYLATLTPSQSYFDVFTSQFSRSVRWPPLQPWHPEFLYAGRNLYAYVLAAYGKTALQTVTVDTFDFISVQLYETCSSAAYFTDVKGMTTSDYIVAWVTRFMEGAGASPGQASQATGGWFVDFSSDQSLPGHFTSRRVEVHVPTQLVVGLIVPGYGSAEKMFFAQPESLEDAWAVLRKRSNIVPRGVMFWNIGLDVNPKNGTAYHMARGLNRFLKTRQFAPMWVKIRNVLVVLLLCFVAFALVLRVVRGTPREQRILKPSAGKSGYGYGYGAAEPPKPQPSSMPGSPGPGGSSASLGAASNRFSTHGGA